MENEKRQRRVCLMDTFPRLLFVALFSVMATLAFAQNKTVTGVVVDNNNEPIIGASAFVDGTTNGTITDLDGKFSLANVPNSGKLKVSYIGYVTQEITVAGKTSFRIVLVEDAQTLDEVVVVGYGVQKKSDVTGAMTSVGAKELTSMPVRNALEGIQGKAAGVDITSNQRPGEVAKINIRGVRSLTAENDPLYVVDGMVIQNGGIDNINPADIETIDILKDASATAIYGSRGANGVILVTTKKGASGKVQINYAGTVTIEKLKNVTDYMSAAEWMDYSRLAYYNAGTYSSPTPSYADDYNIYGSIAASWANIDKAWSNGVYEPSKVGSYDWASHGRQTGITHEHTLSASGGSEKFQGYGSFGYLDQKGTQPGQEYTRYTVKTSFDITPGNWFNMGTSINLSYADQDYGYNFTKGVAGAGDIYGALQGMLPWTVPYDENGIYIRNPNGDTNIINPIDELKYTTNNRKTFRANGRLYAQIDFAKIWKPLEGLKYMIQFGPEFKYYTYGRANDANGINGGGNNIARYENEQYRSYTLDNLVYYDKVIKDHKIGVTLMQSASEYHFEKGNMTAHVATGEELWYNLSSNSDIQTFGTELEENQMASYMGRLNYSFKERYLLTASMRWDGSSVLADGNKWASFPSVALAWRIDQEGFMKKISWVNQLKLRAGVGITGNAAIDPYSTKGAITSINYQFGTTNNIGYMPSDPDASTVNKLANSDLSWERTTQWNVGLDFSVLNGRLGGNIDLYTTRTKDLLMAMSIPSLNGYVSTNANVGGTKGNGIDIQLNSTNIQARDFTWRTSLSWSKDKTTITALANGNTADINNKWFVGEELGVYYDYVYDGVWKTSEVAEAAEYGRKPGQIKVKDLSGSEGTPDGKIDANNDRTIVGKIRPDWSGGLSNTFIYKGVELSFFIYSRWGFTVPAGSTTLDGRFMQRKLDYWIADVNENAYYYSPGSNGTSADTYASSMGYQDGSFIKVRNISVGYNFSPKTLNSIGINNLKVYAQVTNPFNIYTKCDWLDTDLVNYNNGETNFGSSTTTKGFVIGVNVGF